MKYGLPYKGSKNKLAERIIDFLPEADHLYDMFCGGCAVAHAAMVKEKFKHVHINDINWMCPQLFTDALNGKYADDIRWISREDFERLKDTDPYVAVVWSFGNNLRDYMYSRDIEPLKRAIHYAMFFGDYNPGKELGHDFSFVDDIHDISQKYAAIKRYFIGGGTKRQFAITHSIKPSQRITASRDHTNCNTSNAQAECRSSKKKIGMANSATSNGEPMYCRLQSLESKHVYQQIKCSGGQILLTTSAKDYSEVEYPDGSIIYCDIPYKDTNVYDKNSDFDYPRFYNWAMKQNCPVFISSYWMPEKYFECVDEYTHQSIYCATKVLNVTEKIFVPRKDIEPYPYYKDQFIDFDVS